jgi:hypothetical protein
VVEYRFWAPTFRAHLRMLISMLMVLGSVASAAPSASSPSGQAAAVVPVVGVPFACGRIHTVSQGHDTGSHLSNDTHAWDFRMPTGTPIVSAKDGVVRMARGDSVQGACDPKMAPYANYVVIDHGDGLETQYLHFSAVTVAVGERVKQGQLIGFSGNTGWSCGPHLHFKVAKAGGATWNNPSVPANIEGYGDPVRDTLIAAPLCKDTDRAMMAARTEVVDPSLAQQTSLPGAADGQQASGGIPRGAQAIVQGVTQPQPQPAQGRGEAPASGSGRATGSAGETRAGEQRADASE